MELFIFWSIINVIVGAAIGSRKNMVGAAIILALVLGPIGWIIALVMEGNFRKCPFCAENIKDAAVVCPHCQRDLPLNPARPFVPPAPSTVGRVEPMMTRRLTVALGVVVLAVIATIVIALSTGKESSGNNAFSDDPSTPSPSPTPEFVRLTTDYTFWDSKTGREIKTAEPGTKLRVVRRSEHEVVVTFRESNYAIPTAMTEPAK